MKGDACINKKSLCVSKYVNFGKSSWGTSEILKTFIKIKLSKSLIYLIWLQEMGVEKKQFKHWNGSLVSIK